MTKVVLDEEHAFASWFLPAVSSMPSGSGSVESTEELPVAGDGEVSFEDEELMDSFEDIDDESDDEFDDDYDDDMEDDGPSDLADFYETPAELRSLHVWAM